MPEVKPNVKLLRYTPAPEELVAMAGKLCYSPASLDDLQERIETHDQSKYLKKLKSHMITDRQKHRLKERKINLHLSICLLELGDSTKQ